MTSQALRHRRPFGPAALALAALFGATACGEQRVTVGTQLDTEAPTVAVVETAGDTMDVSQRLRFSVGTTDNLGIKTISVQLSGGFTSRIDTTFTSAVTQFTLPVDVGFPANTTAGGWVHIRAVSTDGNNNSSVALDSLYLTNIDALLVSLIRPTTGAVASPGRQILIQVNARQRNGIKKVGWTSGAPVVNSDSILVPRDPTPARADTNVTFTDTLTVPATVTSGSFNVTGFAEDSVGRRVLTTAVTVTIQSVANDTTPPLVTFNVLNRVEVRDSIVVRALDPSGISRLGWTATSLTTGTVVGGDSINSAGTLTDVIQTFNLNLNFTTFPQQVIIAAFAVDAANNRGEARNDTLTTAPVRRDTITVVNGITRPLPAGGRVADAIYNRNLNEIYLTNVELNRVEVFDVTDTAFAGFAFVGAQPWGIGMWPSDTMGNTLNQFVVANSGGTNLSIVNAVLRREIRRHALPNFLIQSVQTELDPATNSIKLKVTEFDFSDRPSYLATSCRPTTGSTACAPDSIFAIYSTTPTIDQGSGFSRRGTLRWEQVGAGALQSHFFYEHATVAPSPEADTLQIIVDRGPLAIPDTILGANCGITVTMDELAFRDTTFVRNSGNFTHALIGEGGAVSSFARAIGYNGVRGLIRPACPQIFVEGVPFTGILQNDLGISPAIRVRDFISNTATRVRSIALNFNGRTNMFRADWIYVLNEALRLMGIVGVGSGNAGMDMNFDHAFDANAAGTPTFGGTLSPNDRLVFAARSDANIDVFDTFFYGRVATIPLRDPVIGPLRVSRLPSGEQVLVGVTARGVVVARLPAIANIYQARVWGAPVQ